MKKRIKLTENQFTSLVRLNEELTNDPISKQYGMINNRLSLVWLQLSGLDVPTIFNMGDEFKSIKDNLEALIDKLSQINSTSEMVLRKIEAEFGSDQMYVYDNHYNTLSVETSNKAYTLLDFLDVLMGVVKYGKLEKMFPPVNI